MDFKLLSFNLSHYSARVDSYLKKSKPRSTVSILYCHVSIKWIPKREKTLEVPFQPYLNHITKFFLYSMRPIKQQNNAPCNVVSFHLIANFLKQH